MKKIILFLLLPVIIFVNNCTNYITSSSYNDSQFYQEISKYQSFDENKYNLYLKEYELTDNLIYALNKVNHPNFLNNDKSNNPSFQFSGGIFVNKNYFLDENYTPNTLAPITLNKISRKGEIMQADKTALLALTKLFKAAEDKGLTLLVYSAYRSYYKQEEIYNKSTDKNYVAKPGESEHQTGFAFDIATLNTGLTNHFAQTPEYLFLSSYAYQYGFIERYKIDKEHITKYPAESWHYRYVGPEIAKVIYDNNLSLEEYIYMYTELS